jgi:hypothetical protein
MLLQGGAEGQSAAECPKRVSRKHRTPPTSNDNIIKIKEMCWHNECRVKSVKRRFQLVVVLTFGMVPLQSATLERLSLDDMIQQSTAIVRGTVASSSAAYRGSVIYTHYAIQVTESFKGFTAKSADVVVPGGTVRNLRQTFPGAPQLHAGDEFVFFLWTGPSGLTQVIGLTQGLFSLASGGGADPLARRPASSEMMLDRGTGQPVKDETLVMKLSDLRSRIAATLKGNAPQ